MSEGLERCMRCFFFRGKSGAWPFGYVLLEEVLSCAALRFVIPFVQGFAGLPMFVAEGIDGENRK